MSEYHREVSDEEIGIRAFKIRQAKAVERAVERMRHGLGPAWSELGIEQIEELEWILGELWAYVSRSKWDDLHFGLLTLGEVLHVLQLGEQMRRHTRPSIEVLHEIDELVSAKG